MKKVLKKVSDQTELQAMYYGDLLLFATMILPHHFYNEPAPFHKEICNHLKKGFKKNVIVAPREHAKSTLISLVYVLHCILYCEAHFIIILSDTEGQAALFLDTIKNEIETNEEIHRVYGHLKGKGLKWGETEIDLINNIKIICKGAGQKVRGLKFREWRPDLFIIDDLENDEGVESKERRKKLARWFHGSVLPSVNKWGGKLVMIGTILHYDSLLMKLAKDKRYNPLFYRAIMKGKPLWADRLSLDYLNEVKQGYKDQGQLDTFYCEYMNEPISDENAIFKKDYFRYFQEEDLKVLSSSLSKFITVDPAISQKESSDYTAIMICGIDALNNIYILEYLRERFTPIETMDQIFKMVNKWKPTKVGIEGVAFQRSLQWFIEEEMKRRNKFFIIDELKADVDKQRRIRGIQPRYALGTVYHRPYHTELEEELLLFPKSPHDDLADALAYIPQLAFPGKSKSDLPEKIRADKGRQEACEMSRQGQRVGDAIY